MRVAPLFVYLACSLAARIQVQRTSGASKTRLDPDVQPPTGTLTKETNAESMLEVPHSTASSVPHALKIHAGCEYQFIPGGCPCGALYDALIDKCEEKKERAEREYYGVWFRDEMRDFGALDVNCTQLIEDLWSGVYGTEGKVSDAAFPIFLKSVHSGQIGLTPEEGASQNVELFNRVIVFWAGFSWWTGTRQVLDHFLRIAKLVVRHFSLVKRKRKFAMLDLIGLGGSGFEESWEVDGNGLPPEEKFYLFDIEHREHGIGEVMRDLHWDRRCHKSGHDSTLWLALSREYAAKAKEAQFPLPLIIFVNYELSRLPRTFLFKHELGLMERIVFVTIVDYKNDCKNELISAIKARLPAPDDFFRGVLCLKGQNFVQGEETFIHQYESQRASRPRALSTFNFQETSHESLARLAKDINLFEAGYAPGIEWVVNNLGGRAGYRIENPQTPTNFPQCQNACDLERHCIRFTWYTEKQVCAMFHRDDEHDYRYTNNAISGHKTRPPKE